MQMIKRLARRPLTTALLSVLLGGSVWALQAAPYLPRLLVEGYPPLIWTGQGDFAEVAGVTQPSPLPHAKRMARLSQKLHAALDERGSKAFLIWKNGKLTLEHYSDGLSATTRFNSYSMVKSLIGALIFKAIADGKLSGLDTPIGHVLPKLGNAAVKRLPIRMFLTMRSGIAFELEAGKTFQVRSVKSVEDSLFNPFGPMARLHMLGLEAIKSDLLVDDQNVGKFAYQNVNTALLAAVLEQLYKRPLPELLSEKLWKPAGARNASWRKANGNAPVSAYCCLFATARDWIKIGVYLSRNGTRKVPFLPETLWREYLGLDVNYEKRRQGHYGFHIFQDVLDRPGEDLQGDFTYLMGSGGQVLYLMPQRDFIVLRFGNDMQLLHTTLYEAWRSVSQSHPLPVSE